MIFSKRTPKKKKIKFIAQSSVNSSIPLQWFKIPPLLRRNG